MNLSCGFAIHNEYNYEEKQPTVKDSLGASFLEGLRTKIFIATIGDIVEVHFCVTMFTIMSKVAIYWSRSQQGSHSVTRCFDP